MSSNDRSYRAGKYGEDETGSRARARREAKQQANNDMFYDKDETPDSTTVGMRPPPPPVIPDHESWVDDVSALTGLTGFPNVQPRTEDPSSFGSLDEHDQEDGDPRKPPAIPTHLSHGNVSLYPDVSELHQMLDDIEHMDGGMGLGRMSKLSAVALKEFEAEKQKLDAEANEELAKLAFELNMDHKVVVPSSSKATTKMEDETTGTTAEDLSTSAEDSKHLKQQILEMHERRVQEFLVSSQRSQKKTSSKDSGKERPPRSKQKSHSRRIAENDEGSARRRKTSSDDSSSRRKISSNDDSSSQPKKKTYTDDSSSQRKKKTKKKSSSRNKDGLNDETLAQLTNVVVDAVTLLTNSSKDKESADGTLSHDIQDAADQAIRNSVKERKKKLRRSASKSRKRREKVQQAKNEPLHVSFSRVQIRSYERILSDNPSCTGGPAVGIGWNYDERQVLDLSVDRFETHRTKSRAPTVPVLSRFDRETLLEELGYTRQELASAVRSVVRARNKRRQTVTNLYAQGAEERAEKTVKFVKKRFALGLR